MRTHLQLTGDFDNIIIKSVFTLSTLFLCIFSKIAAAKAILMSDPQLNLFAFFEKYLSL